LGASGNRTQVVEGNGRTVNYGYDDLYRLTSETINNAPNSGQITYQYDAVGNRLARNSSVNQVPSQSSTFDNNDRLTSDGYDNNGSTKISNGKSYNYDFENKLTATSDGVNIGYDGDGNRISKTVNGQTTFYLVDTNNLTGYAQVVEELQNGVGVIKSYTYGLDLISQRQVTNNNQVNFYQYDGHGSVRGFTDATAQLTDTYAYDAFGTLIEKTGTTVNSYLYAGEQFDADLGFYYNRARYLNVQTGRFISQDSYEGDKFDPSSLHKYLYTHNNPVNGVDPTGMFLDTGIDLGVVRPTLLSMTAGILFKGFVAVLLGLTAGGAILQPYAELESGKARAKVKAKADADDNVDSDENVFFAHGTSKIFADEINYNGVNEEAIRRNQIHFTRVQGSFYVLPILPPDLELAIDGAKGYARRQPGRPSAVLIGKLPKKVFEELKTLGLVYTGGTFSRYSDYPEWEFKPGSFPVINNYNLARWRIIEF
jgi:RHS repeat-associated protein